MLLNVDNNTINNIVKVTSVEYSAELAAFREMNLTKRCTKRMVSRSVAQIEWSYGAISVNRVRTDYFHIFCLNRDAHKNPRPEKNTMG
eukprot:g30302.t1